MSLHSSPTVMWFRRDLRVADHEALAEAAPGARRPLGLRLGAVRLEVGTSRVWLAADARSGPQVRVASGDLPMWAAP